jgi:hypothetical protein
VTRIGEERKVCKVLVGKPEGERPLRRPRRWWEDVIRMDLREIGWRMWIRFNWLRIGIGGELFWMRWWNFVFWRHGISQLISLLVN